MRGYKPALHVFYTAQVFCNLSADEMVYYPRAGETQIAGSPYYFKRNVYELIGDPPALSRNSLASPSFHTDRLLASATPG